LIPAFLNHSSTNTNTIEGGTVTAISTSWWLSFTI